MTRSITFVALGLLASLLIALPGQAQDFEVASVKAEPPPAPGRVIGVGMTGGPGTTDPTRVRFTNFTLRDLISSAYEAGGGQVSGPADWTGELRYEVIATLAKDTTEQQFRVMLQHLLAERFDLAIRREYKTMNVYSLTIAKGGPKLLKPAPDKAAPDENTEVQGPAKLARDKDGYPVIATATTNVAIMGDHGRWHGHNEATSYIAKLLGFQLGTPVQDDTGLTRDIRLHALLDCAASRLNSARERR
jgi:uncharacterized protein (TIGR03435 family)